MKYLVLLSIFLISCKKKEPIKEKVYIYAYSKNSNAKLKVFNNFIDLKESIYSNSFDVSESDLDLSIKLDNSIKSTNDSIYLKVTYKDKIQSKGFKLVNTIGTISFYLK
jgi:hypothetical protein